MKRISLRIDRLKLRGVAPEERDCFRDALLAELHQLLRVSSELDRGRSKAYLNLGQVNITEQATPTELARVLAKQLVEGLKRA